MVKGWKDDRMIFHIVFRCWWYCRWAWPCPASTARRSRRTGAGLASTAAAPPPGPSPSGDLLLPSITSALSTSILADASSSTTVPCTSPTSGSTTESARKCTKNSMKLKMRSSMEKMMQIKMQTYPRHSTLFSQHLVLYHPKINPIIDYILTQILPGIVSSIGGRQTQSSSLQSF